MNIFAYAAVNSDTIADSLGLPDYSYYFVLRDFLPVLRELGKVTVVHDLEEVPDLCSAAWNSKEDCIFLSFTPPHKAPLDLPCQTIPVFAWEFYSLPSESWQGDVRQNWVDMLRRFGKAITHSELIVRSAAAELGDDFSIISVPSPVWDRFSEFRLYRREILSRAVIKVTNGVVADTHDKVLAPYISGHDAIARVVQAIREHESAMRRGQSEEIHGSDSRMESTIEMSLRFGRQWLGLALSSLAHVVLPARSVEIEGLELQSGKKGRLEPLNPVEPPHPLDSGLAPKMPIWAPGEYTLELSGVVFTALFNPYDGRKNWADMLTAFCSAFRETEDATLIFKLGHREYESAMHDMLIWLARMPKFKCRVILLQGYLEGSEFDNLIQASAFAVNASHGEGQCLPLMEFLSCGRPAIAPRHSAMLDYMDEDVGFVVSSWEDGTAWSHDPRLAYRTLRHQIDWASLKKAYLDAYQCFKQNPEGYRAMSECAITRMQRHCSRASAKAKLSDFLNLSSATVQ